MTDPIDNEHEELKRKKSGKGDSDGSFGEGAAGAGAGVGFLLSSKVSDKVKGEHRHLVGEELIEAFVEFFSETLRASANLVVTFVDKAKATVNNINGFAIINWAYETGKHMAVELARNRERLQGADARGLKQKSRTANKLFTPNLGPTGPTGAQ